MSREIKFRAWYAPERSMLDWDFLRTELHHYNKPFESTDDYQVMQYTGLVDKDGKEIYEGDIVEIREIIGVKRDVVTMERFPVFWLKKEEFGYEGEELESPQFALVIGNIYENPELLKGGDL